MSLQNIARGSKLKRRISTVFLLVALCALPWSSNASLIVQVEKDIPSNPSANHVLEIIHQEITIPPGDYPDFHGTIVLEKSFWIPPGTPAFTAVHGLFGDWPEAKFTHQGYIKTDDGLEPFPDTFHVSDTGLFGIDGVFMGEAISVMDNVDIMALPVVDALTMIPDDAIFDEFKDSVVITDGFVPVMMSRQLIPEPHTISLLSLGVFVLFANAARRRQRCNRVRPDRNRPERI